MYILYVCTIMKSRNFNPSVEKVPLFTDPKTLIEDFKKAFDILTTTITIEIGPKRGTIA